MVAAFVNNQASVPFSTAHLLHTETPPNALQPLSRELSCNTGTTEALRDMDEFLNVKTPADSVFPGGAEENLTAAVRGWLLLTFLRSWPLLTSLKVTPNPQHTLFVLCRPPLHLFCT